MAKKEKTEEKKEVGPANLIMDQLKKAEFPSAEEWVELISETKKSSLRKAYRVAKAYLTATCETIGIYTSAKYGKELKKILKGEFTYETFLKIVNVEIPKCLERIEAGETAEDVISEAAEAIVEYVEERLED